MLLYEFSTKMQEGLNQTDTEKKHPNNGICQSTVVLEFRTDQMIEPEHESKNIP